jgi:hypothetical protein
MGECTAVERIRLMQEIELAVETDEATSIRLREDMAKVTNEEIFIQKREGLGGIVADFITMLQAAAPIVAAVMPFVIERARQKKVRRLRFGDFEIENPTDEQVRALWERFQTADPDRKA